MLESSRGIPLFRIAIGRRVSSIPRQLATFAAVLAVLYTGGFIAGQFIDTGTHGGDTMEGHGGGGHGGEAPVAADQVRGLAVADDGLRLALETPELRRGRPGPLRFSITGSDGRAVRDFDVAHEKRMHLIVVRRDLTGFQHLHPRMDAAGTWSTTARLDEAGTYRVFADFTRDGRAITLASDLRVDGSARLGPLPRPRTSASSGGYQVRLDAGGPAAEREADLRFTITRDGQPVRPEPYLGAGGHLVALREGDLAFLHVHPTEHGDDGVAFAATFPTEGRYRLFLQFKDGGRVHTVAFTQAVSR